MIKLKIKTIMQEIKFVFGGLDDEQVSMVLENILGANIIVCAGAGRVGLSTKAFAMRLGHLGLDSFFIGDSTVPHIGEGDTLLVASGSGETQTIYDLVQAASDNRATVILITGNKKSRMGRLADTVLEIRVPSKTKPLDKFTSKQPMTSLNEQCLWLLYDALVLELMEMMGETHETMWNRHSILE